MNRNTTERVEVCQVGIGENDDPQSNDAPHHVTIGFMSEDHAIAFARMFGPMLRRPIVVTVERDE